MQSDDFFLVLRSIIQSIYGSNSTEEVSTAKAEKYIDQEDSQSLDLNLDQSWHKEIGYPYLRETAFAERELVRQIVIRKYTRDHLISEKEFNQIISENEISGWLGEWQSFIERIKQANAFQHELPVEISDDDLVDSFINRL